MTQNINKFFFYTTKNKTNKNIILSNNVCWIHSILFDSNKQTFFNNKYGPHYIDIDSQKRYYYYFNNNIIINCYFRKIPNTLVLVYK